MGGKSTELMADQTRAVRFEIHRLMADGLDEGKALLEALPDDGNRRKKLSTWRKRALWPIPAEELAEHGTALSGENDQTTSDITAPTSLDGTRLVDTTRTLVAHQPTTDENADTRTSGLVGAGRGGDDTEDVVTIRSTSELVGTVIENPDEFKDMISQLLSLHRAGRLSELAGAPAQPLPPMPKLTMKPTSTYLSVKLMEMAEAKAQDDPTLPVGTTWNRSTLVSYLVWQYAGRPSAEEIESWSGK